MRRGERRKLENECTQRRPEAVADSEGGEERVHVRERVRRREKRREWGDQRGRESKGEIPLSFSTSPPFVSRVTQIRQPLCYECKILFEASLISSL